MNKFDTKNIDVNRNLKVLLCEYEFKCESCNTKFKYDEADKHIRE